MTDAPARIAMWSGPRNLSTALMRSWGNRRDCTVTDEPLYAHYLQATGIDHPARAETLATYETDWRVVGAFEVGQHRDTGDNVERVSLPALVHHALAEHHRARARASKYDALPVQVQDAFPGERVAHALQQVCRPAARQVQDLGAV